MIGVAEALARLDARCRRAEKEFPHLAAPDGTVAVPIGDLRLMLNAASADTHPKGGDAKQAPALLSGAVGDSRDAQTGAPNE